MRSRTTRPFGLVDALLLPAAAAVGLAGVRYQAERLELTVAKLWPAFLVSLRTRLRFAAPRVAGRVVGVLWLLLSLLIVLDRVESVGILMEADTFFE